MPKSFLFVLFYLASVTAEASIFGDGILDNGIEDQRRTYAQAEYWASEFNAVGKLVCEGAVKGSAILLKLINKNTPIILTAAHVIKDEMLSNCGFALGASPLRLHKFSQKLVSGELTDNLLPIAYEGDWAFVEIESWPQWNRHALDHSQIQLDPIELDQSQATYFFLGYDLVHNQMMLHADCSAGSASDTYLLAGHNTLVWDNCDSTGGASGGGLFIRDNQGVRLLAIRVGSLFEQASSGFTPALGAIFELDSHINVSRLLTDLPGLQR